MAVDVTSVNNLRACSQAITQSAAFTTLYNVSSNTFFSYNSHWTDANTWSDVIPAAPTGGTVLCVGCMRVGTDSYLRCGASCSWTVPAGVTTALFELWGPGGGTMPGCCCSIQPFGFTGEYTAICRPVQAGDVYFLNAGCSYCCYAGSAAVPGICGACTYVCQCGASASTGCGCFYNGIIYARSGRSDWFYNRIHLALHGSPYMNCMGPGSNLQTLFKGPGSCSACEACCYYREGFFETFLGNAMYICGCGESCFNTSTVTYGTVPSVPLYNYCLTSICQINGDFCLNCTGVRYNAIKIPSRSPEFCFSGGTLCGYVKHPAIPGFANSSQCCVSWSSLQSTFGGALCSPINGNNYLTAPGSGGNMVYTVGGCNSNCGDAGRGGMVRVTYC